MEILFNLCLDGLIENKIALNISEELIQPMRIREVIENRLDLDCSDELAEATRIREAKILCGNVASSMIAKYGIKDPDGNHIQVYEPLDHINNRKCIIYHEAAFLGDIESDHYEKLKVIPPTYCLYYLRDEVGFDEWFTETFFRDPLILITEDNEPIDHLRGLGEIMDDYSIKSLK